MHEAHGPEKPIHSPKEFLFHMFTVMLGLLLALGLEALVEWRHHRHLAHQASDNMRREMTRNRKFIHGMVDVIPGQRAFLVGLAKVAEQLGKQGPKPTMPPDATWNFIPLLDGSYQMARTNNALSYLPIEDATRFSDAYTAQSLFGLTVTNAMSAWTDVMGCLAGFDELAKATEADGVCLRNTSRILLARLEMEEAAAKGVEAVYADALDGAPKH